jgi:hypothetical protein
MKVFNFPKLHIKEIDISEFKLFYALLLKIENAHKQKN